MADETISDSEVLSQTSSNDDDERLSKFLEEFPVKLHSMPNEFSHDTHVFWTQNKQSQSNSSLDVPDPWVIHEKIKTAFSKLYWICFDGLIQFWAPVKTNGRLLLSTSDQPFVLQDFDFQNHFYRYCCTQFQYNMDVNNLEDEEDSMIINGTPANAFIEHLPKVIMDLSVQLENVLVRDAFQSQFTASLMLPVFDPSQGSCVGVIECCRREFHFPYFEDMICALEQVGLSMFTVHNFWPREATYSLSHTIGEALEMVCESHGLDLAQVWIKNHVPFSTFLEDTDTDTETKRMFALKLGGFYDFDSPDETFRNYYITCDMLPLKMGEGLVGKTLETYEAHFCKNMYELTDKELSALLPAPQSSCFVIHLKSIDTGDLEYAFEFFWPEDRNYLILLGSLLLTLKRCLPSFKLASGAEIGDELRVVDIEKGTGTGFFKIFQGNRILTKPKSLHERATWMHEECKSSSESICNEHKTTAIALPQDEDVKQQFQGTMAEDEEEEKEEAAKMKHNMSTSKRKYDAFGISEGQEPKLVKKKLDDLCESKVDSNQEDNIAKEEPVINNKEMTLDEDLDMLMATSEQQLLEVKVHDLERKMQEKDGARHEEVQDVARQAAAFLQEMIKGYHDRLKKLEEANAHHDNPPPPPFC